MGSSSTDADYRARIHRQEVVTDLSKQALETADLDGLLEDAALAVAETLDVEYCTVFELRPDRTTAALRAGVGWSADRLGSATASADRSTRTGYAVRTGDPVVTDALDAESRFSTPELLADRDLGSGVTVRIGSDEEPWGVLGAYATERHAFTDADVDFLERVADVLGSAIENVRTRREFERTERRFEAIFEDPNILVGLLEPDGTVVDINGTAMEYIDADLVDVTGEPFWETPWWGAGDDGEASEASRTSGAQGASGSGRSSAGERRPSAGVRDDVKRWTERAAAGEYVNFEAALTRPDGQEYALEGAFRPVTNDEGEVVSVIVSDRDVTERKERERQLEESEQRYRTLVENFPNGAVALVDEDVTYQTVGGSPTDTAGATVDEVEGKPVEEAVPPSLAEDLVPCYEAALRGESRAFETTIDDRVYDFHVVPVRDDDGEVLAALGMSQDVTERYEYERELEESEQRYRTLVENFPNGAVGLYDEGLEYIVVGGEAFDDLGISEEEVAGATLDERYPDDLVAEIEPYFRAVFDGESNTFEYRAHGRDVWAHTLPVRNEDDEVFAGMVMVQDVTERREYERKLEESNERLERFAYAASHDLQEPLRMVTSYLTLLENRYADAFDEEGREFLEFAVDGAERMREMIDGLLEYSRVETRGDPFEPMDLDAVVDDVLADLQFRIEETDAEITVEDLPRVEGDAGQLRQVFQNLLSNALTYSGDEPPRIHVGAERRNDEWVISVEDEGIGIEPEDQNRVFTIFDRLHSRSEYDGTGIGLALCERIVERHGGEIWVDSEPGEGSTFSVALPASRDS